MLQSFKIMDYSLLVGVHNMDSGNSNGGPRFSEGGQLSFAPSLFP